MTQSPRPAPARRNHFVAMASLVSVLVLGALAASLAAGRERDAANARDTDAAERSAVAISEALAGALASLRGVDGMAIDAVVTSAELDSFAGEIVDESRVPSIAQLAIVPAGERSAFESAVGFPIVDRASGGGFAPAEARDVHLPIIDVVPDDGTARGLLGFDIAGDPSRRTAAERAVASGGPELSDPVRLAPSGQLGWFVVQPIFAPGPPPQLVGYLAGAISVRALLDGVRELLPDGVSIALIDGDQRVSDVAVPGHAAFFDLGGRSWTVTADDPDDGDFALAWTIAAATIVLAGLLAWSTRRDRRARRDNDALTTQLGQESRRNAQLAAVARGMSTANTADEVFDVVVGSAASAVGADVVEVGLFDRSEGLRPRGELPLQAKALGEQAIREGRLVLAGGGDGAAGADGLERAAAIPLVDLKGSPVGALSFGWHSGGEFDDFTLSSLSTLGDLCEQTVRRAYLTVRGGHMAALAGALAASSSSSDVAATLAEHGCQVVAAVHVDVWVVDRGASMLVPLRQSVPTAVGEGAHGVRLHDPVPAAEAVRSGAPVWLRDLDVHAQRFPDSVDDARAAGFVATAAVPMVGSEGRPAGVLMFAWDGPINFEGLMGAAVTTVTDLAAQTLNRAEGNALAQRRAEALGALAQALAATVTRAGIVDAVAGLVPKLMGSSHALVSVLGEAGRLENLSLDGVPPDVTQRYRSISVDEDLPAPEAFRTDTILTFADRSAYRPSYPHLDAVLARSQVEAGANLPLRDSAGRPIGVLSLLWAAPMTFDATIRATLVTLSDLIGPALERADLHERDHAVVVSLQRGLLRTPPTVPGLDLACRYEPATRAVGIGGDWYDGIALPDGALVLMIGDVSGHGVDAVVAMAQIQHLIGGLVRAGTPPGEVFATATAMLSGDAGYSTAQLFRVDPTAGRIEYVNAGHPWALLRRPDGEVVALEGAHLAPIGTPLAPVQMAEAEFPPGSLLLAYTDGLIERRYEAISSGIERLRRRLAAVEPDRPLEELLADLVEHSRRSEGQGDALDDDVAVVILRAT